MRTRGHSEEDAALRIDAQPLAEEKLRFADVVIENAGTRVELDAYVTHAFRDAFARWQVATKERAG